MKKLIPHIFPLLTLLCVSYPALCIETDCNDPDALQGWQRLIDKYPTDNDLKELFGLRVSLCQRIDAGDVDAVEAASRFEQARQRLIRKWEEQNQQRQQVTPNEEGGASSVTG